MCPCFCPGCDIPCGMGLWIAFMDQWEISVFCIFRNGARSMNDRYRQKFLIFSVWLCKLIKSPGTFVWSVWEIKEATEQRFHLLSRLVILVSWENHQLQLCVKFAGCLIIQAALYIISANGANTNGREGRCERPPRLQMKRGILVICAAEWFSY